MPFNGSGTYSPPSPPNFPAISGAVITAAYYNNVINDIASGLTACITRDGQGGPSAAINWNGQNLTNVATFGAVTGNFSGAVSVGTTLTVTGAATFNSTTTIANNTYHQVKNGGGSAGRVLGMSSGGILYIGDIDNIGNSVIFRSTGSDRLTIESDGDVGIGTSAPAGRLDVAGGEVIVDNGRSYGWRNSGGSSLLMLTLNGANNFQYGPSGAFVGNHEWYSGGALRMQLSNTTGFLGIGGVPNFRLDVRGTTDTTHALISGVSKAIRFQTTTADSVIEGVDQTGGGSYQPLTLGGSQVSISQSGSEVARFSATNLRVLGNVFVGSVSAGNQLATLASPAFTGTPTAPTAAGGSNDTTIATTAFVRGNFALLISPAFTGTPTAPTAANGTNTTQLATTAFVQSQLAANAYAPLASPALTGTPTSGGIEIGYRNIPRVTGGVDAGKCNAISAGLTLNTGPAAGTTYSIYNDSAAAVTITQGAGLTLRLGGTATTGNRTLAARGFATVWYNSTTEAIMQGSGVS